ncbi:MAG TPA: branched-chain amino acid ABC transporter permease, partial [Acidimicrobiales bacterium]|nr:branched-chain amino acid ABC transporter permease [Acidimicrobiales bacterium]
MTSGALLLGLLNGLLIGLLAVGIVIVYKANRFLNLAHGQLGALPAMLLGKFVLDWGWPWWEAFVLAVAAGVLTGVAVDRFLVRPLRERTSSRISLLLLSVGAAQLLLALVFVPALGPDSTKLNVKGYPVPFHASFGFGGVIVTGQYLLIAGLAPVLIAGLAAFLRYTTLGKSIRAAASNPDEARVCGISIRRVSAVTWALAGGLSAVTAILQAPSQTQFDAASLGPDLLLLALGAAAVGAFVSIPGALAGGLIIGLAEQLTLAATSSGGDALLVVVGVILATLLIRGRAIGKVFEATGSILDDRRPVVVPEAARQ